MPQSVIRICFAQEWHNRVIAAHTAREAVASIGCQECHPAGGGMACCSMAYTLVPQHPGVQGHAGVGDRTRQYTTASAG